MNGMKRRNGASGAFEGKRKRCLFMGHLSCKALFHQVAERNFAAFCARFDFPAFSQFKRSSRFPDRISLPIAGE